MVNILIKETDLNDIRTALQITIRYYEELYHNTKIQSLKEMYADRGEKYQKLLSKSYHY